LAKQIVAQHVRCGDAIAFPEMGFYSHKIESVIARDSTGRLSAVLVNTQPRSITVDLATLGAGLENCPDLLRLDGSTAGVVVREATAGIARIEGYGLAVVSEDASRTVVD
jgi:hypothetical protein